MDTDLLKQHIREFNSKIKKDPNKYSTDKKERAKDVTYYSNYTREKILAMGEDQVFEYLSRLWAMLIWGNKQYYVDKIIEDNSLNKFVNELALMVWGKEDIAKRWDRFRKNIKGVGPAMISEILCKSHPNEFIIWNRRAFVGFKYLGIENLPRYNYQLTGKVYKQLCEYGKEMAKFLTAEGSVEDSLLAVDYFIWDELQVEENLSQVYNAADKKKKKIEIKSIEESKFIHNEVRDKLKDIGIWLGFDAKIEQKVADGSKVDTIWEASIGNMGRVIYVFEVQTKGNIDSLMMNLLKSLNNPAVQGVVAVSDKTQIEKIKKHADGVKDLKDKLRYWDYNEVLQVHENLEYTNSSINKLGLVPDGIIKK